MAARSSVIVVTLNRPEYVKKCLQCLEMQEPRPDQIIVVDASKDDKTAVVVAEFPGVLYLRNDNGFGRMTASRNIGLKQSIGDIIAYVDDDAFAHPGWLAALLSAYTAPEIGAVGGRALNNAPDEATRNVDKIGKVTSHGDLEGNFAADPGKIIPVEHIIGCNMSFRRAVLARLGGFREDFPGISGICEDTDMSLRVRRVGYTILFNPASVVDHIAAPQAKGQRFDLHYAYSYHRNWIALLIRNFGLFSHYAWGCLFYGLWRATYSLGRILRGIRPGIKALQYWGAVAAGLVVGLVMGVRFATPHRGDPVRTDPEGLEITRILNGPGPS